MHDVKVIWDVLQYIMHESSLRNSCEKSLIHIRAFGCKKDEAMKALIRRNVIRTNRARSYGDILNLFLLQFIFSSFFDEHVSHESPKHTNLWSFIYKIRYSCRWDALYYCIHIYIINDFSVDFISDRLERKSEEEEHHLEVHSSIYPNPLRRRPIVIFHDVLFRCFSFTPNFVRLLSPLPLILI